MATASTVLSNLKAYTGKPNDDTYLKAAIASALREVRHVRTHFSEAKYRFFTEQDEWEYERSYPGMPADLLRIDTMNTSIATVSGTAVIQANEIVTKTNLTEGSNDAETLSWINDRPHDPDPSADHLWTPSTDSSNVNWVVEFATPENAVPNGSNRQSIRLLARQKNGAPTSCTVTLTDKSDGSTQVFSESITLAATATIHEITWDARMLDVNPPTDLQLTFAVVPDTSGGTNRTGELLALEWITDYEAAQNTRPVLFLTTGELQNRLGASSRQSTGIPEYWSWHYDTLLLEPRPNGVYEVYGTYKKDATRDSATGDEITASFSGTETNDWLDRGQHVVEAKAMEIYYMHRAQNPQAAEMARMQYLESLKSLRSEMRDLDFQGVVKGYL